jgi:hypothetical protein
MANEKKNTKNPLMLKGNGKSLAEMVAEVTSDNTESQNATKAKAANGFKVFKENLELYTGVKGQGLAIWVPAEVKKQVEILCAKAKTNIPIRSMAAAMIMAFIEEHRRELNNL